MPIHDMDKLFHPDSIAVIGATDRMETVGSAVMQNLLNGGYKGTIYPVNPNHSKIYDIPSYRSVVDIEAVPDMAVIITPISAVTGVVKDCVQMGISGAVVISAGGKEIGAKGRQIEEEIKKVSADTGFRIMGPNCLGFYSANSHLNAHFGAHIPGPGKLAFISQSGAIITSILDMAEKEKMGFSYVISLGSMLDVDFGDVIDFIGNDPNVDSIVMYVESLTRIRNFMSAARAVSRVKPVIALKSGRSTAGAKAAASHTGALTGEDATYDAAFKRAGIVRVKTFEELFDCAELLAKYPRKFKGGLAVITNAGGPGVMAVDALSDYGEDPISLNPETIDKLSRFLPIHWSHGNPIDILGDANPERYKQALETCLEASEVAGVLTILSPQALTNPTKVAQMLVPVINKSNKPVFMAWLGGDHVEPGRHVFNTAGIPTFNSPERAIRACMDLKNYSRNIRFLQETPSNLPRKIEFNREVANETIQNNLNRSELALTEVASKFILLQYGIPVNAVEIAENVDEAISIANRLGYPVVLKIYSKDISHKSDVGGVKLNLTSDKDVSEGYQEIISNAQKFLPNAVIEGVMVQTFLKNPEYELILGAKNDSEFGPVILFGMGGIFTEVLKDRAIALPPLNRLLARRIIEETKIYQLLKGYRNKPAMDITLLEELLIRLSQLMTDFSEIKELDMNPLMISAHQACVADARIILKKNGLKSPMHLIISPYPRQYEFHTVSKDGQNIFIRPIRPEDAPLLIELAATLSERTIYRRFFSPLRTLPYSMLARFTQIDYDREMALVAMATIDDSEKLLGVARIINDPSQTSGEFAVLVGDQWQGKGIGVELLKRSLTIAKQRGLQTVTGTVLAENTQMIALARKLGFEVKRGESASEYEVVIDLTSQLSF